jgi:hypothetical protein
MKKLILLLILIWSWSNLTPSSEPYKEGTDVRVIIEMHEAHKRIEYYQQQFQEFLDHLAYKESTWNPDTVNSIGYIGKYQFGRAALKDVGLLVSPSDFRKNPKIFPEELQDSAVVKLMTLNKGRLLREMERYIGLEINGTLITEAGLLAAAHLAGAGGVKRFLRNPNKNPQDVYGTSVATYLEEFSNFDIKLQT